MGGVLPRHQGLGVSTPSPWFGGFYPVTRVWGCLPRHQGLGASTPSPGFGGVYPVTRVWGRLPRHQGLGVSTPNMTYLVVGGGICRRRVGAEFYPTNICRKTQCMSGVCSVSGVRPMPRVRLLLDIGLFYSTTCDPAQMVNVLPPPPPP